MVSESDKSTSGSPWPMHEPQTPVELAEPLDLRPLDWQAADQEQLPQAAAQEAFPASTQPLQAARGADAQPAARPFRSKRIGDAAKRAPARGLQKGFFAPQPARKHTPPQSAATEPASTSLPRPNTDAPLVEPQTDPPSLSAASSDVPNVIRDLHTSSKSLQTVHPQPCVPSSPTDSGQSATTHISPPSKQAPSSTVKPLQAESASTTQINSHPTVDDSDQDVTSTPPEPIASCDQRPATEAEKTAAFVLVQPHCAAIMQSRDSPSDLVWHLNQLQEKLPKAPLPGLRTCTDYLLLPLVHLADSIAATRAQAGVLVCACVSVCACACVRVFACVRLLVSKGEG